MIGKEAHYKMTKEEMQRFLIKDTREGVLSLKRIGILWKFWGLSFRWKRRLHLSDHFGEKGERTCRSL